MNSIHLKIADVTKQNLFFDTIYTINPQMIRLIENIKRASVTNHPCLIMGETGTGKELIARALHLLSPRQDKPFIVVNCGSFTKELIQSELFGFVKGAFTNAWYDKKGLFEIADGGTLFLDEIGELPPEAQAQLLRAIEFQEVKRIGSNISVSVDVRIISATHRNLGDEVQQGRFRDDLFFRLSCLFFTVPPLRERKQDIEGLIYHLFRDSMFSLTTDALYSLHHYNWPGNIRELKNVISRAVTFSDRLQIDRHDLIFHKPTRTEIIPSYPPTRTLADQTNDFILSAIVECDGNLTLASKKLKISKTTLYKKINESKIGQNKGI